jgi:hypothetical protein
MTQRLHFIFWGAAVSLLAYACFEHWSQKNMPLYARLERQWQEDVTILEASQKLPTAWFDVRDLEVIGGTPETRDWLKRIRVPLTTHKEGKYGMEVLVVAWEESGKRGTLIQYNLTDLKSKNGIWELGRTLILSEAKPK